MTFLKQHWFAAGVFFTTSLALFLTTLYSSSEASLLQRYAVSLTSIQPIYVAIIAMSILIRVFQARLEPYLETILPKLEWFLISIASFCSFFLVQLIQFAQETRTFEFPYALWVVIVHGVVLCALVVARVINPTLLNSERLSRISSWIVPIFGAALVVLHIASVGEFMRLDMPDEPLVASMATNFAENNQLSPSFLGSPYGTPDPSLGRYFLLMGLWLKATGDSPSLIHLRAFPLLVGSAGVAIFAYSLWRIPDLSRLQRFMGIVIFLALSTVVRTSHNLRMDTGLIVYGALVFLGLTLFEQNQCKRWLVLTGSALFVGLQSVPTVALLLAFAVGIVLMVRFFSRPHYWLLYGLVCVVSLAAFYVGQFLPDLVDGYTRYQRFTEFYIEYAALSPLNMNPLELVSHQIQHLFNYLVQFNFALSPIEFVFIAGAFFSLARHKTSFDRALLWICVLTTVLLLTIVLSTYSYWVILAPFIAYGSLKIWKSSRLVAVGAFILIPALASAPIFDFLNAIQERPNHQQLAEAQTISPMFPKNITIVGESLFWFTLHQDRNFIHWSGIFRNARAQKRTWEEILRDFDPDMAICWTQSALCSRAAASGLFDDPETLSIHGQTYLIFQRAA
jgi:hypothetical protein